MATPCRVEADGHKPATRGGLDGACAEQPPRPCSLPLPACPSSGHQAHLSGHRRLCRRRDLAGALPQAPSFAHSRGVPSCCMAAVCRPWVGRHPAGQLAHGLPPRRTNHRLCVPQAASLFDTSIDLPRYLDKSFWKTASLMAASCRSAAVFSECSPEGGLTTVHGHGAWCCLPAGPTCVVGSWRLVLPGGWPRVWGCHGVCALLCEAPRPTWRPCSTLTWLPCAPLLPPRSQGGDVRVRQAPGPGLPGGGRHPRLHAGARRRRGKIWRGGGLEGGRW